MSPNALKKISFRKELLRKLVHLMELPVLIVYSVLRSTFGDKVGSLALTLMLIILLELEYIRLEYKLELPKAIDILRRHERDNLSGSIFFIAGTIIAFAAYDFPIALLALLMTVFGDLMSALVGMKFGRYHVYKKKTLEGFLAGLVTNLFIGSLFMPEYIGVFASMAIVASVVELFTGKLDDNLTVPLSAGFAGQVMVFLFQLKIADFPSPVIQNLFKFFGF